MKRKEKPNEASQTTEENFVCFFLLFSLPGKLPSKPRLYVFDPVFLARVETYRAWAIASQISRRKWRFFNVECIF